MEKKALAYLTMFANLSLCLATALIARRPDLFCATNPSICMTEQVLFISLKPCLDRVPLVVGFVVVKVDSSVAAYCGGNIFEEAVDPVTVPRPPGRFGVRAEAVDKNDA